MVVAQVKEELFSGEVEEGRRSLSGGGRQIRGGATWRGSQLLRLLRNGMQLLRWKSLCSAVPLFLYVVWKHSYRCRWIPGGG
jgi:hypothetical protein